MIRNIPSTMSTQHPDNACEAYWCGRSFINTTDEVEETYVTFRDLGCDEYMWDWEGKFVDEAVIDKLLRRYADYFKKHSLGREKFLTYRIPNIWEEKQYRLARAFMNIVTSAHLAEELGFHSPPIIEVILPMTRSAKQIFQTEQTFRKIAKLQCEVFGDTKCRFQEIGVIPLVETVEDLCSVDKILEAYLKSYHVAYKKYPSYMRPFIARSDPALNAGLVPAVLASKAAISHYYSLQKKYNVPMFPIIGTGSLPFRGGVNPDNIGEVLPEYKGIRTITIQSAFKYDYPLEKVRRALKFIDRTLPTMRPEMLTGREILDVKKVCGIFAKTYKETIEPLAKFINQLATFIPPRRERMLHIGLFGYSRGMGKVSLPRAITFTGAFYSIGVPPEFIATGRALRQIWNTPFRALTERLYVNLRRDLIHAGKYLNKENLAFLAKKYPSFRDIAEDIQELENLLGIEFGPLRSPHFLHRNLTSNIYHKMLMGEDLSSDVVEAAKIRKSLG